MTTNKERDMISKIFKGEENQKASKKRVFQPMIYSGDERHPMNEYRSNLRVWEP